MYGEIICQTCLSSERLLHSVDNLECLLRDVNIHINNHGGVCWECKAIMDKFYRFKKQVIKAQDILQISTVKVTSLSSLKECKTDIDFHINFDESPPIAEVKIEENFTIHDVLDIIDEKPNFDDDMINHLSCDENEEISISLEQSSKSCYEIEKNLSPLEPRSKLCDEIEENPKLLKPRAKKKSSKFKIDIRKEGEEKKNDYKDKFTTIVFTEEEVNRHREEKRNHPNFKKIPYKCDTCVLGFNKEDTFIVHMTTKHNETIGIFVCDVCKVRFPGLYAMERHRQCHYTRYRCKLCKYEATRIQVMLSHCQVKHSGDECGMIRCQQCEFTAGSPEEMSDHQTKEHSLICNDCGMKFKGKPTLRKHKKRIHGQNREFICDVCNKTFKTKSRLESHIVTHSDSIAAKLSYCAVCQMQYKNIYVYRNHLKNNVNHSERSDETQSENDCRQLCKINESFSLKALDVGFNSELKSEIDLDRNFEADDGDFSATDGSDYEPDKNMKNLENPVKKSSNNKSGRIWDRKNACCYCNQLVTNFSRHILRKHKNEREVMLYASIKDSDLKERKRRRQEITDKLRNLGNFLFNNSVANIEGKDIIPNKRAVRNVRIAPNSISSFVVCKNCLGTYKRASFYRHLKACEKDLYQGKNLGTRRVVYSKSLPILPSSRGASEELKAMILPHLRNDEISDIVKNDFLIMSFGTKLVKERKYRRSRKTICSKMRELATLLQMVKNENPETTTLEELLDPSKYEVLTKSIRKNCEFSNKTSDVKITSISARLRSSLLCCVDLLFTQIMLDKSLNTDERDYRKKKLDKFKLILKTKWQYTEHVAGVMSHDVTAFSHNNSLTLEELQKGNIGSRLIEVEENRIESKKKTEANRDNINKVQKDVMTNDINIAEDENLSDDVAQRHKNMNVEETTSIENKKNNTNKIESRQNTIRESDTDSEDGNEYKEYKIRKEISNDETDKTHRKKKTHLLWTEEELNIVLTRFKEELTQKRNPGKAKCTTVLREEPILHRRTWMQLNTCVNNMYMCKIDRHKKDIEKLILGVCIKYAISPAK